MKRIYCGVDSLINRMLKSKADYENDKKKLSFEEKLKIMVKLQEKSYAMGATKIKPWPIK